MNKARIFLILLLVAIVIAGASYFALMKGVNMMRDGLVANYPVVKYVVAGALVEVDSTLNATISKTEYPDLYNALCNGCKQEQLQISAPYYARYEIGMNTRYFRIIRDKNTVEVWLPEPTLAYCELKFDQMKVNGTSPNIQNFPVFRKIMYEHFLATITKHKANMAAARKNVAKALIFYFVPYKLDLKLYIGNQLQTLPEVPGVTKDIDSYIKENFGQQNN